MPEKLKPCPFCGAIMEKLPSGWLIHPTERDCVILGVAVKPELVAAWNNCRRETIKECAAILDENARYFTGRDDG